MEEMIELYFPHIEEFIEGICETTFQIAKHDEEDPRKYALNVWITLANKERHYRENGLLDKNYIKQVMDKLLEEIVFHNIQQVEGDPEDFDIKTYTPSAAAALLLKTMALDVGKPILEPVINFSGQKLAPDVSWEQKYAGLISLGAILELKEPEYFMQILEQALEPLVLLMSNELKIIRLTVSWVFTKIAENVPDLILNPTVFGTFYELLINGIERDCSEVACRQTEIISKMAKNIAPKQATNIFSDKYQSLIQKLTIFMFRTDNNPVNGDATQNGINATSTIVSIIELTPQDQVEAQKQLLETFYGLLQKTLDKSDVNYG